MAIFNMAGGVAGLNFSVVGSTEQPQGKEHLVWVKTDVPITSWVVSPNEPQNPAEGMVWILDGDSNGINILRKNAVEVFPSGCKQYIGGAWESLDAFLFRAGSWIAFSSEKLYLYDSSATDTQCTGITGGWAAKAWKPGSYAGAAGTPSLDLSGNMVASMPTNSAGGAVHTQNNISFGNHKILCASFEQASVGGNVWGAARVIIGKSITAQYSSEGNTIAAIVVIDGEGKRTNFSIDDFTVSIPVDSISGEYPVIISLYSTASVKIKQIWFED